MQENLPYTKALLETTKQNAREILEKNTCTVVYNGKTYRRTVPSMEYYKHQWNWDSATVAMGLVHINPQAAYDELRALIAGQWDNGMIAHVTYNPDENSYYPQAEKWRTDQFHHNGIKTSGITNPPVLAIGVEHVYRNSSNKEAADTFLAELLPATMKFHDYLKTFRDPEDQGLLTIIHSWESGTDNSPRWDPLYAHMNLEDIPENVKEDVNKNRVDDQVGNASHRPKRENYYHFMGLIDLYANWNWDYKKIVKESPFAAKDILLSAIWARANESLADLLEEKGDAENANKYRSWSDQTKKALANTWDEEYQQYVDRDVSQSRNEPIKEATIAMFLPLWAGAVTDEQLPKLMDRLSNPEEFWTDYPVASTAINDPKFEISRYWRGPTWPVINMFIVEGLMRYKDKDPRAKKLAEELIDKTLGMIIEHDFYEYYDPTNGHGAKFGQNTETQSFGFADFSWSSAVFIYLYEKYRKDIHQHESSQVNIPQQPQAFEYKTLEEK